jgi:hypothetical protein
VSASADDDCTYCGIAYWFARACDSDCGSLWYVAIWSRIFLFAKTMGR